jgi:hypothetical protein
VHQGLEKSLTDRANQSQISEGHAGNCSVIAAEWSSWVAASGLHRQDSVEATVPKEPKPC